MQAKDEWQTMSLLIIQAIIGILMARQPGMKLFGGESKAKSLWKWHRASGYAVTTLLVVTVLLATTSADWVLQHSSAQQYVHPFAVPFTGR